MGSAPRRALLLGHSGFSSDHAPQHGHGYDGCEDYGWCHADTMNVNAAKLVYVRRVRSRSSTDAPMARMTSEASRAESASTFTPQRYERLGHTAMFGFFGCLPARIEPG